MLRSAATPNRTDVQLSPEMTELPTRRPPRRPLRPAAGALRPPPLKSSAKLTIVVRLFKD
jgi:hypothetical protein